MYKIIEYIKSREPIKLENNTILIKEGEFQLLFSFHRKIDADILSISRNLFLDEDILGLSIRRQKQNEENFVLLLYNSLNIYYSLFCEIPDYKLINEQNESLFFEFHFSLSNIDKLQDFILLLLNSNLHELSRYKDNYLVLTESSKIAIVQSNTKARRIGYWKMIISMFRQSSYFPIYYLNRKIESDSIEYNSKLIEYGKTSNGDDKGLIKNTSSGISAKPYIELLENINLITVINNSYILTKQCKVYHVLYQELTNDRIESDNLFKLSLLDKIFFLRQLLIHDHLYIWAILDIMRIIKLPTNSLTIKKLFVEYILNELNRNQLAASNNTIRREILELKKRINSWKKPLVYLEHIIEPRLNWLLDLGILEKKNAAKENIYLLSFQGEKLCEVLSEIFESHRKKQIVLNSYLINKYFNAAHYIFNLNNTNQSLDFEIVELYLFEAFKYLKTDAPNRIAASQAIDYVCFKLFLNDNIVINFSDLKRYFDREDAKFSLDWFKTENDGAIYIKK